MLLFDRGLSEDRQCVVGKLYRCDLADIDTAIRHRRARCDTKTLRSSKLYFDTHVVHVDPWWRFAADEQSERRASCGARINSDVLRTDCCFQTTDIRQADLWSHDPEFASFTCDSDRGSVQFDGCLNAIVIVRQCNVRHDSDFDPAMLQCIARFEPVPFRKLDSDGDPLWALSIPREVNGDAKTDQGDPPQLGLQQSRRCG